MDIEIADQIKADIEILLKVARPKLITADKSGDSNLFNVVSIDFGPIAHRVYLALDLPERSCERYHDALTRRVMLDPWTVLNRANSFCVQNFELTIDDPAFWIHCDMIKTLCDYLDLRFNKEDMNASSERTSAI